MGGSRRLDEPALPSLPAIRHNQNAPPPQLRTVNAPNRQEQCAANAHVLLTAEIIAMTVLAAWQDETAMAANQAWMVDVATWLERFAAPRPWRLLVESALDVLKRCFKNNAT